MRTGQRLTKSDTHALMRAFENVPDGRIIGMCDYPLHEVLLLVFLGVLANCNRWTELEIYGKTNIRWLKKFYKYQHGTPSHDELRYIFGKIPTEKFQDVLIGFLTSNIHHLKKCLGIDQTVGGLIHYAIDGKEENGTGRSYSSSRNGKVRNMQTLHVWNVTDQICIYSKAIDEKTNEIPVAQRFLESQKSLKGILITFDALHTQKATWKLIRKKKGACIAGLKGNQSSLLEDVTLCFDEETMEKLRKEGKDYKKTKEKARSQIETREYYRLDAYEDKKREKEWGKIESFVCVLTTIEPIDPSKPTTQETRYYISTLTDVSQCADGIREHWMCESGHWCLDVVFCEDDNTTMDRNAYQNLSLMIKAVLHLLKLLRILPQYKNYGLATLRKAFSWNSSEEIIKSLFTLMNKKSIEAALGDVKLTPSDKKKAREMQAQDLMEQETQSI